ncbi:MAG: glycerophosphodiester phosphodiesterase [Burkholderiaceae bacterium]|nr:glycerophosphodiester phosphodiesterase [Burkholderiaceae bacterium]
MPHSKDWPYPRFVAHRGGGVAAPENTLAGMRAAVAHAYRMVEFDVKLSRDGVPVLMHDVTLERTTNGIGPAGERSFAELARLDAGSWHSPGYAGEPVPGLESIARYARAVRLACNVEIKPTPGQEAVTGSQVALACAELWEGSEVPPLLSSFSLVALEAASTACPQLPRGMITAKFEPGLLQALKRLGCVSVHLLHKELTRERVASLRDAGYRVAAWTVNDAARAVELLDWGVDAVITDEIVRIVPSA